MIFAWHDFVGLLGVLLVIGAYFLSQIGKWPIDHVSFPLTNALGALLILISLYFEFNFSAFLVELAWLLISVIALIRLQIRRKAQHNSGSMPPSSIPHQSKDE